MSVAVAARPAASIDRLRSADLSVAAQAALVVGTAALTALLAQAELRIYLWEVPLTLQTLAVYGSGLVLGRRNGALAMGLYLLAGLALPVYAGGASGAAHLLGASAGYLVAFPLVALLVGTLTERRRSFGPSIGALAAGSALLFACGVCVLHVVAGHATWGESIVNGWLRFVPWDLAKITLVGAGYAIARRLTA